MKMEKIFKILISIVLLGFSFLPMAYSAPQIDGVMSYTDANDWGSTGISKTTTNDFWYSATTLSNVVVEEGDAYGEDNYDVEELGVYIEDNTLYIGLQTEYDLSSNPSDSQGVSAGDFIFTFGNNTDDTLSDYYEFTNDGRDNENYEYAFAFDFTIDASDGSVDVTYLSGDMTGTGHGTYANNYGTDWGIESASTSVALSDTDFEAAYSNSNTGYENCYYNGKYTLELAINLDSLSDELSTLLGASGDHETVVTYWQPSCGNDFLAAKAGFDYSPTVTGGDVSPTPEPATMLLFGMGLLGASALGRRRKRSEESD